MAIRASSLSAKSENDQFSKKIRKFLAKKWRTTQKSAPKKLKGSIIAKNIIVGATKN